MVDIEIIGPGGPIIVGALLDSGADRSLFNIALAEAVGIDLSKAKLGKMIGIGSTNKVYDVDKVEMRLKGFQKSITIPVSFIDNDSVVALMG